MFHFVVGIGTKLSLVEINSQSLKFRVVCKPANDSEKIRRAHGKICKRKASLSVCISLALQAVAQSDQLPLEIHPVLIQRAQVTSYVFCNWYNLLLISNWSNFKLHNFETFSLSVLKWIQKTKVHQSSKPKQRSRSSLGPPQCQQRREMQGKCS